jgi:hypothetical protein
MPGRGHLAAKAMGEDDEKVHFLKKTVDDVTLLRNALAAVN